MAKTMRCRDVELDCDFVARGESEVEIMRQMAEHARIVHQMRHLAPELAARVRAAIHDELTTPPPAM